MGFCPSVLRILFSLLFSVSPALAAPKSVLLVLAHPDDETMLGGTLLRFKELGVEVNAVYLTRGEGGRNLLWEAEITKQAAEQGIDLQGRQPRDLPSDHPLRLANPFPDLAAIRDDEMKAAAQAYGIREWIQLSQPDEFDRERKRGVTARWDIPKIESEVAGFAAKHRPDLIVTLLPDNTGVHVHHQETGKLVRRLFDQGRLGPNASAVYGIAENDWYPEEIFQFSSAHVAFERAGKYAEFQAQGAGFHRTQAPAYRGISPLKEFFAPIIELRPGTLRRLLGGCDQALKGNRETQ